MSRSRSRSCELQKRVAQTGEPFLEHRKHICVEAAGRVRCLIKWILDLDPDLRRIDASIRALDLERRDR